MSHRPMSFTIMAIAALAAGPSLAAEASGTFAERLAEAKAANFANSDPEEHGPAAMHISTAEQLYTRGDTAKAQQYLNVARSILDLPFQPNTATLVGEKPGPRNTTN